MMPKNALTTSKRDDDHRLDERKIEAGRRLVAVWTEQGTEQDLCLERNLDLYSSSYTGPSKYPGRAKQSPK